MDKAHIGGKIGSVDELYTLAQDKKSVIAKSRCFSSRSMPAAFAINMNCLEVIKLLRAGLYLYKTKSEIEKTHKDK